MTYKQTEFGLYEQEHHQTPIGRLFWLHLQQVKPPNKKFKTQDGKEIPGKYEATVCFDKESPKSMGLKTELEGIAKELIGVFNKGRKQKLGECDVFQDGDELSAEGKYEWCRGCWVLTARTKLQPKVVDRSGNEVDLKDVVGGVKGRIAFKCAVFASGLTYNLEGIQFWEDDGKRFGGGMRNPASLFDACEEDSKANQPGDGEPPTAVTPTKGQKGKNAIVNML